MFAGGRDDDVRRPGSNRRRAPRTPGRSSAARISRCMRWGTRRGGRRRNRRWSRFRRTRCRLPGWALRCNHRGWRRPTRAGRRDLSARNRPAARIAADPDGGSSAGVERSDPIVAARPGESKPGVPTVATTRSPSRTGVWTHSPWPALTVQRGAHRPLHEESNAINRPPLPEVAPRGDSGNASWVSSSASPTLPVMR